MKYSTMTEREVEIELSTSVEEGLSSFTAHDRLIDNGRNLPEKTYTKSVASVAMMQLTNLYTIAYIVMGTIMAFCDFKGSRTAWAIFFAVAIINMVSGFLHDYKKRARAVVFDKKRSENVTIIRDGKMCEIDPVLLVRGDMVVLKGNDYVPADIRVLKCSNLKANESIFKGRDVPVDKVSEKCTDDVDSAKCENILYSGTQISSGEGVGAVIYTGKDTLLARVNASKSEKLNTNDKFGQSSGTEKILVLLAILAAMVVLVTAVVKGNSFPTALVMAMTTAMCVLPAPCVIVRMIGNRVCLWKVRSDKTQIDAHSLYHLGGSEYFLFDKGGLMTDSEIQLEKKAVSDDDKLCMAAICSDCEVKKGSVTGNGMDVAVASYLKSVGYDVERLLTENEKIRFMPFDEKRMLMACIVRTEDGYRLIVKGSVEVVPTLCVNIADGDNNVKMTSEILLKLERMSSDMAEGGLKVRVLAYKDIACIPENIELEINALTFAGILGFRERLAEGAMSAIEKMKRVYVTPVMVTGDHLITASSFAKEAGLIEDEKECISFHEIRRLSDEELLKCAKKYRVFASATTSDRERLVRVLSEAGCSVVVAGEEMTSPSTALYAGTSIGDDSNPACDVVMAKKGIDSIGELIYKARCTRGNLMYASFTAISVGFAQLLVMLFMLFTNPAGMPTATELILTDMFMVFVPVLALGILGSVHQRVNEDYAVALRCMLAGVLCAILCIAEGGDIIKFTIIYSVIEAGRLMGMYNNLEKGRWGIFGIVVSAVLLICAIIILKAPAGVIVYALIASAVNGVIPYIKLKGLKG